MDDIDNQQNIDMDKVLARVEANRKNNLQKGLHEHKNVDTNVVDNEDSEFHPIIKYRESNALSVKEQIRQKKYAPKEVKKDDDKVAEVAKAVEPKKYEKGNISPIVSYTEDGNVIFIWHRKVTTYNNKGSMSKVFTLPNGVLFESDNIILSFDVKQKILTIR